MNDSFEINNYILFIAKMTGLKKLQEIREYIDDLKQCVEKGLLVTGRQCFNCGEWYTNDEHDNRDKHDAYNCQTGCHAHFSIHYNDLCMNGKVVCTLPAEKKERTELAKQWLAKWNDFVEWVDYHTQEKPAVNSSNTPKNRCICM